MQLKFHATLPALLALCLSAAALAEGKLPINRNYATDDDKPWEEQAYALPAYPKQADWIEVKPDWLQSNRFYVDGQTLSVGQDGVVRFISKVLSPNGVENLSVEGIQCKSNQYRAYGFGDSVNQRWIETLRPVWLPIDYGDKLRRELRERMCPYHSAPRAPEEAVQSLRKGG
ncbi:CNP1-like family protein [Chromobacterium sp. IIBBL 290-4]|uniref:CNP1-like family protein n=1 Tax=Chromobacterium sp. IIBBL 290-4 TaxID=2953890 RepID=UPI0020B8F66D|nr:CNP1-like family protein [Chromobacterium sp. IIBBL 290-4]UTH75554.1 CNP1-like family protein [Chromobacterium sp. IIBBL 290-4]